MKVYEEFVDLAYEPSKNDLIALFKIEPRKEIKIAAGAVAAESSVGTWTKPRFLPKRIEKLKARVFEIRKKEKLIKIAYPIDLFEPGNLPQILSSIAGNVFGMKEVKALKLLDVRFPRKLVKSFKGPKFGIRGVRRLFRVYDRPLIGTIVKPKLGLNSEQHAKVALEAWLGGCDLVKDDENLTNQRFNQFEKRVRKTIKARDLAEKRTGEVKCYMPNITAEINEAIRRAKLVKELGGRYAMVDLITVGWGGLQTLKEALDDLELVIHAHRAMHAAMTRSRDFGISMLVIAKLSRMIGVDQLHTGTAGIGKMKKEETTKINEFLRSDWYSVRKVMPVASGGLHPGSLPALIKTIGIDAIYQFGGGIHGHPKGTKSGARAVRQALDAVLSGIDLEAYAKSHEELREALEKWKPVKFR